MYKNLSITSLENEQWKDLPFDLRYKYQISSLGRLRIIKTNYCCIKIQRIANHGHPTISIRHSKEKIKRYLVHRLVAESFIENVMNKRTVNHINGIKHDNRLENLEWASDYEQAIHRHYVLNKNTLIKATEISKVLNRKKVSKLNLSGELIEIFNSQKEAAKSVNKSHNKISECCNGKAKTAHGYIWKFV